MFPHSGCPPHSGCLPRLEQCCQTAVVAFATVRFHTGTGHTAASDRGCPRTHVCSVCNGAHQPGQPLGPRLPAHTHVSNVEDVKVRPAAAHARRPSPQASQRCAVCGRRTVATKATTATAPTAVALVHTSAALQRFPPCQVVRAHRLRQTGCVSATAGTASGGQGTHHFTSSQLRDGHPTVRS